jgi:prepilin-type N-terminal cleavage/methylation domain-containing protein
MKFALRPFPTEPDNSDRWVGRELRSVPRGPAKWPPYPTTSRRGFTLAEVLAALLMMAIIIPVAMEGMSVSSRIGVLGQRKAAAMRVAERMLNELIVESQTQQASTSGTALEGETAYPWSMKSQSWPEDAMVELIVTVTFTVQGNDYDVSASTLIAAASSTGEGTVISQ